MVGGILGIAPLVGERATDKDVLSRLNKVALLHIAARGHSVLAPRPDIKNPTEDDYKMTMAEVLTVRMRAQLVVLSCCHSGRGEMMAEGVVGIARAFLGAGARSVLVSLWALMTWLPKRLCAGTTNSLLVVRVHQRYSIKP